jgi:3-hydroxyisobutyrate dehydrogenase
MGSRMAMNLLAAGHELRVFNRSKEKTKPLADKGAKVCASPAEAAKGSEFVCSIVSDDVATREVMLGSAGVVGAAAPGTIILDSSTNTPAMAGEVAFGASE